MPASGITRIITGEVTIQKKKGKALTKEIGKAFSPEAILKKNSEKKPK